MYSSFKRLVVGPPLSLQEDDKRRLGVPTGLAVFCNDAISSTAYATQQILIVLLPAAALAAFDYLVPISLVVVFLLVVVSASYRQTVFAYPGGGGSYVVSRENLGTLPSLVAGGSLLVDYVLTVAVSVSSGADAVIAAFPGLTGYDVPICVAVIALMTFANLRGLRTSGRVFSGPTYLYVFMLALLIVVGLWRFFTGDLQPLPPPAETQSIMASLGPVGGGVTFIVLLRAFSSGAVALTGVEAISNGVPAFAHPSSKRAARTMVFMALILGAGFFGISALAQRLQPIPTESQTVLSAMGSAVFGAGGATRLLFFLLQASTFVVLALAANTSFADFPRVSSVMARDRFMPMQLRDRGDRLVYSNGIILLALVAALLIVAFGGNTDRLVPLYAVGVFTAFTLSQSGMVRHHRRLRERGWRSKLAINAVGAVTTLVVLLVVSVSKFTEGAWIPLVVIPLLVVAFLGVHRHYERVHAYLADAPPEMPPSRPNTVVVVFEWVHRGVLDAVAYAESLHPSRLVCAALPPDDEAAEKIRQDWAAHDLPAEPRVMVSPQHDIADPLTRLLDELEQDQPEGITTIVFSEFVLHHWWEQSLYDQNVVMVRARLRLRPRTVVAAFPVTLPD